MPIYDQDQLRHLYDQGEIRRWYEARLETYHRAEAEVEQACQTLDGLWQRLEEDSLPWSDMLFTLGDITADGFEHEAALLVRSHAGSGDALRSWYRTMGGHADATRRYAERLDDLLDMYDNLAADAKYEGGLDAAKAARHGILRLVCKGAGPLLITPASVIYEHYVEDSPWAKAIIKGGTGAVISGTIVGLFTGGWGLIIVAGLAGFAASNLAGEIYDRVEPARVKLLRETPNLEPGSTRIERPHTQ